MQSATKPVLPGEYAFLVVTCLLTCGLSYGVSHHRPMWSDELFAWMLVTDPSLEHMVQSWRAGADGGGIGFYLLLRGWLHLAGRTITAFRLFSALGVYCGLLFTWLAARRFFDRVPLAVSLSLVWFSGRSILWHVVQTRFYGLLLGLSAFALYATVLAHRERRVSPQLYLLTFCAHLLLVATHPLGVLYSGVFVLAAIVIDWSEGRTRPLLYLAGIGGWTVLLFSREALRNTAAVGKPYFWTTRPDVHDLLATYSLENGRLVEILLLLCFFLLALLVQNRGKPRDLHAYKRRVLLAPAILLASVPLGIWIVSQRGTSLFVARYLVPLGIALAIFTAFLLQLIVDQAALAEKRTWISTGRACALFLPMFYAPYFAYSYSHQVALPPKEFTSELLTMLPPSRPVVIERIDLFDMTITEHAHAGVPFVHLLDWESVLAPDSPRGEVSGFHEMENWRNAGYYSGSILQSADFLAHTDHFTVVDDPSVKWFEHRILADPHWKAVRLRAFHARNDEYGLWRATIWEVDRVSAPGAEVKR